MSSKIMYKMVVEISKNKWESCGIKPINYYNEEKNVMELWLQMSHVGTETRFLDIDDAALKRIRKYCGKKTQKTLLKKEKKNKKRVKDGAFVIEKLACDITERCKLPKAIELKKKIGVEIQLQ